MILDEKQLDALQSKYRKIGTVDFSGHQLVFRVPTRDEVRDFFLQLVLKGTDDG